MNIFRFELRSLRTMAIWWLVGIFLLSAIYISVYPAFSQDVETIKQLYADLPSAVKSAMGLQAIDSMSQFTFLGFLGFIFPFLLLAGGIEAAAVGLGLLGREKRTITTDFLLTKPVTRSELFLAKLAAGAVALGLTSVAFACWVYFMAQVVGASEFSIATFALIVATFGYVQVWFLSIGILLSLLVKKIKSTAPLALAVGFGLFVVGMFGSVVGDEKIRYLSPLKHVDFLNVIEHDTYEWNFLIVGTATLLVASMVAYIIYVRRDAPSVT